MPRPSRRRCRPPRAGARHRRAGGQPRPGRRPRRRHGRAARGGPGIRLGLGAQDVRRRLEEHRPRSSAAGSDGLREQAVKSAGSSALSDRFVIGVISPSWSISWSAPRPSCARGRPRRGGAAARPPDQAFATAVAVFVTPGPAVTSTTPVRPVTRAHARAMWPAVSSWRTSTRRMPISWHASPPESCGRRRA